MPAKTYRTIQGDAWDSIAYRLWPGVFKSERLAADLIKANPAYADVLVFSEGVVLVVPEVANGAGPSGRTPQADLAAWPAWRARS